MSGFTWGGAAGATWGGPDGGTWGSQTAASMLESRSWIVGPVRAHHVISDRATIRRGEEVTYEVLFSGRVPHVIERYNALRDRIEYATENYVVTGVYESGTPYFKERHDHQEDLSLLMKVTPPSSAEHERGIWGVLTDAEDTSNKPLTKPSLELTLFVLARDTEYSSHEQVRTVHEADDIIGDGT